MGCQHQCGIVTKRGQCKNKPMRWREGVPLHTLFSREGWPKRDFHYECTFHFNRFGFGGAPLVTKDVICVEVSEIWA